MIKILPLENAKVTPYFFLNIGIGYGEHCDDMYDDKHIRIDDTKAGKKSHYGECMSTKEAEETYKFFNKILDKRQTKDGYTVDHLVLNDGPDEFWHCEQGGMTKEEFKWFEKFYEKWGDMLYPEVEHNWYGIVWVSIKYIDENGKEHRCEVI